MAPPGGKCEQKHLGHLRTCGGGSPRPLSHRKQSQLEAINRGLGRLEKPSFSVQGDFPSSAHVSALESSGAFQSRTRPPDLWYQPSLADLRTKGRACGVEGGVVDPL